MTFEEEIKKELGGLDKKQICQFAWLCAIRALPFLSAKRNFSYWKENDKQKHLYIMFNSLDVSAQLVSIPTTNATATVTNTTVADVIATATAIAAFLSPIFTGITLISSIMKYNSILKYIANDTAYYLTRTAKAVATGDRDNAIYYAIKVACITFYASVRYKCIIDEILFKDIKAIKKDRLDLCSHDVSFYGELWNNFLEDLKNNDCGYWAKLYENLFNNGFQLDTKELERRIKVPDEIKGEGAAAVGRYLENLSKNMERLNETRIIILGEKGAGKTSIARKLQKIDAEMPKENESTEGVTTSIWRFKDNDGKEMNAHIWDFAGHSITHSAHRCFMSARCLYIYVYNGRIERDNNPEYWLEQIRIHGGTSPILFLVNEEDNHKADIAENTLKKEYDSIRGYYRINIGSENTDKLQSFIQTVKDEVCNNPSWNNQEVSEEAYKIKNELRKLFEDTKEPHIERNKFNEIAKKCGVSDEKRIKEILEDLRTLGICLWYDEPEMGEFKTLVLNPDWITNAIYKIINKNFNKDKYILTVEDGVEILKGDKRYKYPKDMVKYLFRLMRKYELAFFKEDEKIFVPGILPLDMPNEDTLPVFNEGDRLTMKFSVDKILPPNIVSRIIVQRSKEIFEEKLLWRKGATLKYDNSGTIALIIEEERNIVVRVKGENKTAYITSLRETIKKIFEDYKVIKPNLLYEVLLPEGFEKSELPESIEEERILMIPEGVVKGGGKYYDKNGNPIDYDNEKTVIQYNITITGGNVSIGSGDINDNSVINNLNFKDCTINLQGELNRLVRDLKKVKDESDDDIEELLSAAEEMEQVEKLIPADVGDEIPEETKNSIKKRGLLNKIKNICEDLNDEDSTLYKSVKNIRRGIKTAQSIAKQYNDIAQWVGLPQVPKPFLGK